MDEDCFEAGSNFQLNERATIHNARIDRISELPNEILFLVLSFLPVRKAASTTVLSTQWLDLWKQNPNLKFNLKSDRLSQLPDQILLSILSFLTLSEAVANSFLSSAMVRFLNFDSNYIRQDEDLIPDTVNLVVESHKAPSLKLFRICFPVSYSAKSTVTKWLEFVFSRQVESLELDFLIPYNSDMAILEESLREMSITCGAPQTLSFCQSLKRLHLQMLSQQTDHLMELLTYLSYHCVALEKVIIRREIIPRLAEFLADLEYLKQRLHGKVRSEIQLSLDF